MLHSKWSNQLLQQTSPNVPRGQPPERKFTILFNPARMFSNVKCRIHKLTVPTGQPSHNRSYDTVNPRNQRFNDQAILSDMTDELPGYHLSNYAGAGTTDVPKHFFHPDMEVSPEELRVQFYLARAQGREAEAVSTTSL